MADVLRGEPEDYMSSDMAHKFRERCKKLGLPPVMYLDDSGRYAGDERGMTINGGGVALHMAAGLKALCNKAKP